MRIERIQQIADCRCRTWSAWCGNCSGWCWRSHTSLLPVIGRLLLLLDLLLRDQTEILLQLLKLSPLLHERVTGTMRTGQSMFRPILDRVWILTGNELEPRSYRFPTISTDGLLLTLGKTPLLDFDVDIGFVFEAMIGSTSTLIPIVDFER